MAKEEMTEERFQLLLKKEDEKTLTEAEFYELKSVQYDDKDIIAYLYAAYKGELPEGFTLPE